MLWNGCMCVRVTSLSLVGVLNFILKKAKKERKYNTEIKHKNWSATVDVIDVFIDTNIFRTRFGLTQKQMPLYPLSFLFFLLEVSTCLVYLHLVFLFFLISNYVCYVGVQVNECKIIPKITVLAIKHTYYCIFDEIK